MDEQTKHMIEAYLRERERLEKQGDKGRVRLVDKELARLGHKRPVGRPRKT